MGPDYRRPDVAVPERFGAATQPATRPVAATQPAAVDLARWWTSFGDPQLDSLVGRAVAANLDLKVAEARVREARAQRRIVGADQWPGVNANGSYRRSRTSENAFSFGGSSSEAAAGGGGDVDGECVRGV